jgi:hypothetical protein
MSPAKKTTRKATAKKASARQKAASKKTTPPKARAKKKAQKRVLPARTKKRIAEATRAAKKTAEQALEKKRPATRAAAKKKTGRRASLPPAPLSPPPEAHPKLGVKHTCFQCSAKFYDLFRPEPLCPKCGADQREAPKADTKRKAAFPQRRRGKRNMAPLLEEEDEEPLFDERNEPGLNLEHAGAELDDPAAEIEDDTDL